jgi:hypothetical protein
VRVQALSPQLRFTSLRPFARVLGAACVRTRRHVVCRVNEKCCSRNQASMTSALLGNGDLNLDTGLDVDGGNLHDAGRVHEWVDGANHPKQEVPA